jgi:hypothetical protein
MNLFQLILATASLNNCSQKKAISGPRKTIWGNQIIVNEAFDRCNDDIDNNKVEESKTEIINQQEFPH